MFAAQFSLGAGVGLPSHLRVRIWEFRPAKGVNDVAKGCNRRFASGRIVARRVRLLAGMAVLREKVRSLRVIGEDVVDVQDDRAQRVVVLTLPRNAFEQGFREIGQGSWRRGRCRALARFGRQRTRGVNWCLSVCSDCPNTTGPVRIDQTLSRDPTVVAR